MKKRKVDISVIVPIYNTEKYLRKCINSLVKQTKEELEFILINDGSPDHSEEIVQEYQDSRIYYYKNKNQGIGKTRNFGIKKATGKYLLFLDSDDYLRHDTCQMLYEKAENENLDMIVFNMKRLYDDGKRKIDKIPFFETSGIKENPSLLNKINLGPCNKIYRTSLIKDNHIQFLENSKYEDVSFVIETIIKANRIGQIEETFYNYVIHGNSETTVRDERCFDIIKVIAMIRNKLRKEENLKQELNILTVRILTNYTIQQRVQKDKKIAIDFINESFQYLKKEIPDFKKNKYYPNRSFFKRTVEKSKILTIVYCKLYWILKN